MEDLTFGEQVKIILGRKGMTIKELAETIEKEINVCRELVSIPAEQRIALIRVD